MDIKMDSRPCAEDHSSPRSPRHVLTPSAWIWLPIMILSYPRIDLGSKLARASAVRGESGSQADFALGVDVWVEATSASICGSRND